MPTYDYECSSCDHAFELFQSISEPVKRKCPACGKPKLRRLFGTGAALLFKGSGFYQTDYRSDSYRRKAESESKSGETATAAAKGTDSNGSSGSTEKPKAKAKAK